MEFFLVLLAPMLWASATLTDKMLVNGSGDDSRPDSLMAVSGFFNIVVGLLFILPVILWKGQFHEITELPMEHMVPLILNGATQTTAMLLFLKALSDEEVSRVDPWFQTIPVFGMLLAYVLINEKLAWFHIAAIGLIATGGWTIMSKGIAGRKVVIYMTTSAFLLAVNDVNFAAHGRQLDTMPAVLLDMAGKALFGLILLVPSKEIWIKLNPESSSERIKVGPCTNAAFKGFVVGLRTKLGLQTLSEAFFISADFFFDRAKLYAPVAIVQGIACTQPMFTILGASLITIIVLAFRKKDRLSVSDKHPSLWSLRQRVTFTFWSLVAKISSHWAPEKQGITFWKKFGGIALIVIGGAIIAVTQ